MAAEKVILYFNSHTDALRFTLAAGSVMAGETQGQAMTGLICETQRVSRIILGKAEKTEARLGREPDLMAQNRDVL
jgi:hypothetical protein